MFNVHCWNFSIREPVKKKMWKIQHWVSPKISKILEKIQKSKNPLGKKFVEKNMV